MTCFTILLSGHWLLGFLSPSHLVLLMYYTARSQQLLFLTVSVVTWVGYHLFKMISIGATAVLERVTRTLEPVTVDWNSKPYAIKVIWLTYSLH